MCGFVGVLLNSEVQFSEEHLDDIKTANYLIKHRGPDDEGYYNDSHIALAFRRLSIIDIEGGKQPFYFGDKRYCLVFNGEIYNYVLLREQLQEKGYDFCTNSDTEVLAMLFLDKGVEAFADLRGMFAVLIWDTEEKIIYGARDPFGIKPFYYAENENDMIFASEQKCITWLNQQETVNLEALQHYFSFQYVPDPSTLTEGIQKLEAGHYLIKEWNNPVQKHRYFHAAFQPVKANENQIVNRIQEVLYESVKLHMQSDVPVGSFLSGGIDSTLIVAFAKQFKPDIKTFSVGFKLEGFSEIDIAKHSAAVLGVENIARIITPEEYVEKLPEIIWHMDDPLADPACVPLYFVAQEARKYVKVVLSGEGADELFGGYNIYREPASLKHFQHLSPGFLQAIKRVAAVLPEGMKGKSFLERGTTPLKDRYIGNAKMFEEKEKQLLMKNYCPETTYQSLTSSLYQQVEGCHSVNQMQYIDMHTWLTGDILLKADRMTMANELELRVPFLDKEVFHAASKIAVEHKISDGTTKSVLRKAAKGIVPDHIVGRRKLGFPVPIKHWLRKELYTWAKTLIQVSQTDHILNKDVVLKLLENHAHYKADYSRKIWTVLMFMLWHQIHVEKVYSFTYLSESEVWSKSS
ncbi:asparagine synthase (glutamine-hydrolyzing) [Virgibacillus sp. C22-A2]|uniref:asparagine synthase (glutamine-hydrolyzing) n=1 Tax=Virgibacillus tibetensis TaxID=3042313 RepID=A0ABU6KFI3_9BACI|nr:asparagine synthase (glutamine-hydrolyzing) [Virgibacillus sp. C22-A2]